MPIWPGAIPFEIERVANYEKGYRCHHYSMGENVGTHVDAPTHFFAERDPIDALKARDLIVPALVIDVREKVANDPDYELSKADIDAWEKSHGKIEAGHLFVMHTGWDKHYHSQKNYINLDDRGVMHFPGFSADAAQLLVQRNVAGIGIDCLSLDPGTSSTYPVHHIMLKANKYMVENLTGLAQLPSKGSTLVIGALPIRDGSQSQARIFALLP